MGAITPDERSTVRQRSPFGGKYDQPVNRESAHEILLKRAEQAAAEAADAPAASGKTGARTAAPKAEESSGFSKKLSEWMFGTSRRQGAVEAMAKSTMRTVGNQLGRQILRGVLGSLTGGKR
jgi:hypothetical protein